MSFTHAYPCLKKRIFKRFMVKIVLALNPNSKNTPPVSWLCGKWNENVHTWFTWQSDHFNIYVRHIYERMKGMVVEDVVVEEEVKEGEAEEKKEEAAMEEEKEDPVQKVVFMLVDKQFFLISK